jgi:hypothetical protein
MEFLYGFCAVLLLITVVYKIGEYDEKRQQAQGQGIATA